MPTGVSYTRVSTSRQGQSGLGLEAQRAAIDAFCAQHGYEIVAPATARLKRERETTRWSDGPARSRSRPCPEAQGPGDRGEARPPGPRRLTSSRASWSTGCRSSLPNWASTPTPSCSIYAALAQKERALISARTKAALKAAKARGVKLGSPIARETVAIAMAPARWGERQPIEPLR